MECDINWILAYFSNFVSWYQTCIKNGTYGKISMDLEIKDKQNSFSLKTILKSLWTGEGLVSRQTQNIITIQCSQDLGVIPNYHQDSIIMHVVIWCGLLVDEGLN